MRILSCQLQVGKVLGSAFILTACLAGSMATNVFPQGQEASEYQVKAAFLYNFTKFVEWPPDTFRQVSDPMTICVFGDDPFGPLLDDAVRGKSIGPHKMLIRRFQAAQSAKGCQIAFISASERKRLPPVITTLGGVGVLTVGETEGFAAMGGAINFVLEEGRVHFEVNVGAAERAGLKISSKLLSLAIIVKELNDGRKS